MRLKRRIAMLEKEAIKGRGEPRLLPEKGLACLLERFGNKITNEVKVGAWKDWRTGRGFPSLLTKDEMERVYGTESE